MAEVLSPCGSLEAVCAAVSGGADAVYLGGGAHNARQYAKNLTADEIASAVRFCHSRGVKVYITLNILEGDRELADTLCFAKQMYEEEADGLIVQDLGLCTLLREYIPLMELHGSTQMSVHSLDGALMTAELGMKRIVLARELSRENIKHITDNCGIETEVFVHGALCYCYSGQCLMSAVIGRRSGNRGRCAGPCRLPYTVGSRKGYPLSLKDLCLADRIKELDGMGVASLKIEGRMKRPEYVGAVTRAYSTGKANKKLLSDIFSRSGFTTGFFDGVKSAADLGVKSGDEVSGYAGLLSAERGRYSSLCGKIEKVCASAADILSAEAFTAQMRKKTKGGRQKYYCFCLTYEQARRCGEADAVFLPCEEILKHNAGNFGIHLPQIITDDERGEYAEKLGRAKALGSRVVCVENIGQIRLARECGLDFICGTSLNAFNTFSAQYLYGLGAEDVLLSVECSAPQIRDIVRNHACGIIVYGRIRLMVSESCIGKNVLGCDGRSCRLPTVLRDRTGEAFPVYRAPHCRNVIYNSQPVWLADREKELRELRLSSRALYFTDETPELCEEILKKYKEKSGQPPKVFTRGMFAKKVL